MLNNLDVTVIVMPKMIFDWRNDYWKNLTLRNSILFDNKWAWFLAPKKVPPSTPGNSICLLGTMRENFGFDILLKILPELNRELGLRLKIIGLESPLYRKFKDEAAQSPAANFIDWRGYVPLEELESELNDCFCSLNLQELAINNNAGIVPGRVVHYLQNLVVPVVASHSGGVVQLLNTHALGVICEANQTSLMDAIRQAYKENIYYVTKINEFLTHNPYRVEAKSILDI